MIKLPFLPSFFKQDSSRPDNRQPEPYKAGQDLRDTLSQQASAQEPPAIGQPATLAHIAAEFEDCYDFSNLSLHDGRLHLLFFSHMIQKELWDRQVLETLSQAPAERLTYLLNQAPFTPASGHNKDIVLAILNGATAVFYQNQVYLAYITGGETRTVNQSETESVITGPHDAFVETAETNLSLLRRRIKSSHLKVIKLRVGEITKTDVYIMYIKGIANKHFVDLMIERISNIEIDAVVDGNMLTQYFDDQPNSVFPQFLTTERTDSAASKLVGGRVLCIVDGSPTIISAPSAFLEFFSSPDDYYQRWLLGTATRLLRLIAFLITVLFTAFYVSVTTYHYEMIPETLIVTLTQSRSRVPFPPLYEALLMETTIELLREAGARLPTKIGQTIGIVGGIVIGQAAVQAGLTSNILIIAVASSAIASFVVPSYVMSASIRLVRFGLIVLAGIWGNFGLILGVTALTIHMSSMTSLGSSYLTPVAPMKWNDWRDVFIRAPLWMIKGRPSQPKSPNPVKNKMRK